MYSSQELDRVAEERLRNLRRHMIWRNKLRERGPNKKPVTSSARKGRPT